MRKLKGRKLNRMIRAVLLVAIAAAAHAQSFEVASVRVTTGDPGERAGRSRITVGPDRLLARGANVLDCIEWAWNLREYQVVGPDRIRQERYDIAAKSEREAIPDEMRPMLQALLAERFGLAVHREKRAMPVLAIVAAKNGPKLRGAAGAAGSWKRVGPGLKLEFTAQTLADLAAFLSTLAVIDRPVVDATGLPGAYTFALDLNEAVRPADAAPASVSSLLQEQLGLRLDGRHMPVEVLVVDRVEKLR